MRNWLALLSLIFMCLMTISDTAEAPNIDATTLTEEVVLATTEPTIEEIIEVTTEATIREETEPIETDLGTQEPKIVSLGKFKLTAYCGCRKCCGEYADNRPVDENGNVIVTGSIGVRLRAGVSIAVDPRVIPYHSQVVINGHTYIAHDTGGGIKGNRIDVYFDDHDDAWNFGVQYAEVFIYG